MCVNKTRYIIRIYICNLHIVIVHISLHVIKCVTYVYPKVC